MVVIDDNLCDEDFMVICCEILVGVVEVGGDV